MKALIVRASLRRGGRRFPQKGFAGGGGPGRRARSSPSRAVWKDTVAKPVSSFPFQISFLPPLPGEPGPRVEARDPGPTATVGGYRSERALLSPQKPPVQPLQLQLPPGLAWQVAEEEADRQWEPPVPETILPQGDPHPGRGHPGLYLRR